VCFASTGMNAPETKLASLKFKLVGWRADRFWPRPLLSVFRCLDNRFTVPFLARRTVAPEGGAALTSLRQRSKLASSLKRERRNSYETFFALGLIVLGLEIYWVRGRKNLHLL
jgi:hypothetical protein